MKESGIPLGTVRLNRRIAFLAAVAGCAAITLADADSTSVDTTGQSQSQTGISLTDRAKQALNLLACQVIDVHIDAALGEPLAAAITIDQQPYTLDLQPYSVRAPGYELLAQVEDGSLVPQEPGPVNTLRGRVVEMPGSQVAAGLYEGRLHALILTPDNARIWIEPLVGRIAGAAENDYVVYYGEDVLPSGGVCGVADEPLVNDLPIVNAEGDGGGGGIAGTLTCAQVGVDADFEYYLAYGQNVTNVQNRINLVINTMNIQYENQCGIRHMITTIIVRTAEPDPYSSTSAGTLLNQFAIEWNTNQASVKRDLAHLFTGKNLNGSTIGIATLGTVCNIPNAYGLVQSDCCGSLACATDLSAHEIGHNWSAQHCSSSCSSTMNSGLTCVNTFFNSNPNSVTQITNYANSVGCLASCEDATTTLPFFDDFPSTTINQTLWTGVDGAQSNTFGLQEPSAPNSLNLDGSSAGGDQVRSAIIDPTPFTFFKLEYYYQRGGGGDNPEPGDDLVFEFQNSSGSWIEVSRQFGNGPQMANYQLVSNVFFPAEAYHPNFRLRIRCISNQTGADDWFVDNIAMSALIAPGNNNCTSATIIGAGNHAFTTVGASTDGPDEPASCNFNGFTQVENDVWFRYIAQCNGIATISLCGADYDSKLAVYSSACPSGSGQALACADNTCGDDPEVTIPVMTNQVYRVRIGGVNGAMGAGTLSITCDSQQPCPADINNSGAVDVTDLLAVINGWGPCPGCPADIDDSGTVDVTDLLAVINGWGTCP